MQEQKSFSSVTWVMIVIVMLLGGCAGQIAHVQQGDPSKSYFKDQVVYPFKVQYAQVQSADGTDWQIGYMDVKPHFSLNPKVLVMIHGRAFSGAYFGSLIKKASKSGIRVIVPDLPNYGKSLPGNIEKPLTRTMQQAREIIHDLIVNKLGIEKATYGGHSMGGQFVLGYALTYPEAVEKIILEAPAGLEEIPEQYFPSQLVKSTKREDFANYPYYAKKVRLDFSTNAERLEQFYFYELKVKGKLYPYGFFKKRTEDARLATEIRTKMITGNPNEFERYAITSIRDAYNVGIEIKKEDQRSLFKKYERIRAPVLLIFGEEEPFFPKKVTGLKDLKKDIIKPFYQRMTNAGTPVSVKLYPGCGHFPHTDSPDQFAADIIQFMAEGVVEKGANPMRF